MQLMTIPEALNYTRLSRGLFYRQAKEKVIPLVRIGGKSLFVKDVFDRRMKQQLLKNVPNKK